VGFIRVPRPRLELVLGRESGEPASDDDDDDDGVRRVVGDSLDP
jgi:hypothetical protein